MRWRGRRQSSRVEDRRGRGPVGKGVGIGGGGLLLVVLYVLLTGKDPQPVMEVIQSTRAGGPSASIPSGTPGGEITDELGQFASVVLADTEDTWNQLFGNAGHEYREPTLVLFSGQVRSACGFASAAVGPFYCPADSQVYIDLDFFGQLARRFGAPGDFAQAYVIAHEVGHHVQNLLGISDFVRERQRRLSRAEGNEMSVRLELQADCLAGVWGHHQQRRQLLEPGDIEEGMGAAAAVGDDTMQRRATGTIQPESWTHGSAEQRQAWFRRGLQSGDPDACDTFSG